MKLIATLITAIALTGCISVGTQVTHTQAGEFKKGVTTFDQVTAGLGKPNTISRKSDGTISAIYTYVHSQARPESFIPFVGLIAGGADSTVNTAEFVFDEKNVLKEYTLSESIYGGGYGVAAGSAQPRTDQPKAATP